MAKTLSSMARTAWLPAFAAILAVAIFVADTVTTVDIEFAILYVVVVLLSARFLDARGVVLVAVGCAVLTIASFFLSPPGGDRTAGMVNTAIGLGTIALTAILAVKDQSRQIKLLEAQERFRVLAESSLTGIYLAHGDHFQYVNPAFARMFGYSVDEVVDRLDSRDLVWPPDRPTVEENTRRRLEGEVEEVRYEFRGLRKDGSSLPVEVHGRRIALAGKIGIMGTLVDNTERQRAMDALRETGQKLEHAQRIAKVGWWELDYRTGHVSLSDQVCRILGVEPLDLPMWYHLWRDVVHPEDRAREGDAFAAALKGGPRYDVEFRVVRPDGNVRIVHSQGDVAWDESKRPLRQFGALQDITELRQMEQELRASEARFRVFVDQATDAFFLHDAQLVVVDVNQQACDALGYSREELIGMHPREFDAALDATSMQRLQEQIAAGEVATFETRHRRKDGTVFPVEIRARQFEHNGIWYVGSVRDITDRKRTELELEERQNKLREIREHLELAQRVGHVGSAELDLATTTWQWSEQLYEIFGFDPKHGPPTDEQIAACIHPEDRPMLLRRRERSQAGEQVDPVEYRIIRLDGRERWLYLQSRVVLDAAGRGRKAIATVHDITDRKRAQQRLLAHHAVTRILGEATGVEEATPKILEALCEHLEWHLSALWRVARESGALRCEAFWRMPSVEAPQFEAATRQKQFRPGVGLAGRVWAERAPRWVAEVVPDPTLSRAPIAWAEGIRTAVAFPILLGSEVLGVVEFFSCQTRQPDQDVLAMMETLGSQIGQFIERKRAENALQLAQAELAHVTRVMTLSELTASIAHEINQPIAASVIDAGAALRFLTAQPPALDEARQALEAIVSNGRRAGDVIGRIRALIKKAPPRKDSLNINDAAREVVELARTEAAKNGVSIQMQLGDGVSPILGDRVQLQQVILNLVVNSIEAMGSANQGRRELLISTAPDAAGGVSVSVCDTGPGLDATSADRVFERFYTTKPNGLGMGLAICRSIVEAHGGRIRASANEPRGAIFQFLLPSGREAVRGDGEGAPPDTVSGYGLRDP